MYSYYNIKRAKELAWIFMFLPSLPEIKSCNNEQKWSVLWNTLFKNNLVIQQLGCHSLAPGVHIWHLYSTGCPEHRHSWSSLQVEAEGKWRSDKLYSKLIAVGNRGKLNCYNIAWSIKQTFVIKCTLRLNKRLTYLKPHKTFG